MRTETYLNKIFKKNIFENLQRNHPEELAKIISRYCLGLNSLSEISKELEISESELQNYMTKNQIEIDHEGSQIYKDLQGILYQLRDYSKGDKMRGELILNRIKENNLDMADSMTSISKKILNKLENFVDDIDENKVNPVLLKSCAEVVKMTNDTFNVFEKNEPQSQGNVYQDNRQINVRVRVVDPRQREKELEEKKLIEDLL